jgi:hypothetical protein
MSDDVQACDKCGGDIVIRWMGSGLVPIHLSGSCGGSAGWYAAPSRWAYGTEDFTRPTSCPVCSADVFFVRHNGGSVWFDELGPPWEKHPCFDDDATATVIRSALRAAPPDAALGIVLETASERGGVWGRVVVRCSDGTVIDERLPFAHLRPGRAVIVRRETGRVALSPVGQAPAGSSEEHLELLDESARRYAEHIVCPRCSYRVRPENARSVVKEGSKLFRCTNCGLEFPPRDGG